MKKTCIVCGKRFNTEKFHPFQKYCSEPCRIKARNLDTLFKRDVNKKTVNVCIECGKEFHPVHWHPTQQFCSRKCRSKYNSEIYRNRHRDLINQKSRKYPKVEDREPKKCLICGKRFIPKKYQPFQKYCSLKCGRKAIDKRFYHRHRDKEIADMKKYRQTESGKKSHRASERKIRFKRKSKKPIYVFGRKEQDFVRRRDNNKCVYCGKKVIEVGIEHFDHIIPVERGGTDSVLNLVLSCDSCNGSKQEREVHEWYREKFGKEVPKIIDELLEKQKQQETLKPITPHSSR